MLSACWRSLGVSPPEYLPNTGTAIFNPRGGAGARGGTFADPSLWRAFSRWLLRRMGLPPSRPPPPGWKHLGRAPAWVAHGATASGAGLQERRPRLVIAHKPIGLRRSILNADALAASPCVRAAFEEVGAHRF